MWDHTAAPNGGFIYVQNTQPNGALRPEEYLQAAAPRCAWLCACMGTRQSALFLATGPSLPRRSYPAQVQRAMATASVQCPRVHPPPPHPVACRLRAASTSACLTPSAFVSLVHPPVDAGAALWVMMEAIGRNLRWRGSKKWFYDTWGAFSSCEAVDQDGLLAALPSAFLGRPVFQYAIAGCLFEADPKRRSEKAKFAHHAHAIDADVALFRNRHPMASVKTPAEWLPVVGSDTYKLHGFPIQVPNTRGKSVDKYGPILYPPQTGALYDELIAQFKSDCPSCPLWPDPLDSSPASLAAIDALKQEQFLYLPSWFVTGYWPRGRYGYWNAALLPGGVPQQVVGHQHYNRQASTIEAKLVGRHAHRQFNWTLAHQLEGAAVYFSSRPGDKDLPTLVAYHPDLVDFRRTGSLVEMQSVLRGLAQVAALANRTVLWPDVPCNTSWAKTAPNGDVGVPLQLAQPVMPYVPHGGDGKHLTCMPWDYANPPCLDEGAAMRGMLQLEYEHLTAVAPPGSYPPPSEANTVFAHVAPEIRRAAGSVTIGANGRFVSTGPRGAVSGDMVNIASDDVASQLAAVAAASPDARIIYVGHPIHVHFTCRHNAQLHHYVFMQDRCPALKKGIQAAGGDASKLPSAKLVPQSTPTTLDARLAASKQVLTPTARLELPTCAH